MVDTNALLEERLREMELPDNNRQDALSVIYGFRPIATVALWPEVVRPLKPQVERLRGLAQKAGCSIKEGWSDLGNIYFFMKQGYEEKVEDFKRRYGSPLGSDEADAALGRLLSYPECCEGSHPASGNRYAGKGVELIPFAPCSYECAKPWIDFYEALVQLRCAPQPRQHQ